MKSLVFEAGTTGVFATVSCLSFDQSVPGTVADAAVNAPAALSLTANISPTTNYEFRGKDQNSIGHNGLYKDKRLKPAIQGRFDYAFGDSGSYLGTWNSSVNWLTGNSIGNTTEISEAATYGH